MPGIYHRVEKGQTLWRISKIYAVDLDELVQVNHISDATNIEVGQMIFVPKSGPIQFQQTTDYTGEDFLWPVRGRVIHAFGQTYDNMVNKGINILPYRASEVVAARGGKVVFTSPDFKGYGKTLIIDHADGFSTVYAMNSEILIKIGENVQRGQRIARIGQSESGRNSYLHFEIRKGHLAQNPNFYLPH